VAAGLEDCLAFLEGLRFEDDELSYLSSTLGFDRDAVDAFRRLRFTGDVWAVPEGTIVFAGEPILEVTAPLPEAQLVETVLLNHVTFQTTVATKAARCVIAAGGRDLVDFAFRRTQGVDAAMTVARATAMVGFVATSNVEAARRFGLRVAGTMAHSFVEAFPTEAQAFRAFAQDFPNRTTFLVDTYDTLQGVRTAIAVIRELGLTDGLAVRLDSGDLASLSKDVRALLDDEGTSHVRIFASGGLDEFSVDELVRAGAPIDAFGVGTRVGVSADAPYLDSVYKLVAFEGRPVMKLSTGKVTLPGAKQVFRADGYGGDVIGLREEPPPPGSRPLLAPVMEKGRRVSPSPSLAEIRGLVDSQLDRLPDSARGLRSSTPPRVRRSAALRALGDQVTRGISADRSSPP
jgi:nicotinate phosphoribosyltransferase